MNQPQPDYSATLDVYYSAPVDPDHEYRLTAIAEQLGGWLMSQLPPTSPPEVSNSVWLSYAFADMETAEKATAALKQAGEYVEGPYPC